MTTTGCIASVSDEVILKIMISSTIEDMKAERDAVDSLITSLHFRVLRSETFGAIGASSREVCERMARECDLYIGIFGNRYGSIIEGDNISVTEMEYDTARTIDPTKILVYLKSEKEYEGEDKLQDIFRSKVTDFSTGYFRHRKYEHIEHLLEQIRKDIASWITERVNHGRDMEVKIQLLTISLEASQRQIEVLSNARGL